MDQQVEPPGPEQDETGSLCGCDVVVVYEDFAAGLRAKEIFDRLVRRFGDQFQFRCKLWKLEVLNQPELTEVAADDAASADLILVAVHTLAGLSDESRRWMERWTRREPLREQALVVVQEPPEICRPERNSLCPYFRALADRRGMDFFCECSDALEKDSDACCENLDERARKTSSLMEDILRRGCGPDRSGSRA